MGILSSIGRFLFGGKANQQVQSNAQTTGTTNSTSVQAPYAGVQKQLDDYIKSLQGTYEGTPQISGYEQKGYDALEKAVGNTSGLDAADAENRRTTSGEYLTPDTNPYLADIAKRVGAQALQAINSTFGGHGRSGSGLHATYAGEGVGNALTDLYGRTYEAERGRQAQAVGMAPTLAGARQAGAGALIQAGQGISARPFDVSAQYSGILNNIARLGGTTTNSGTTTGTANSFSNQVGQAESSGVIGNLVKSFFSGGK